MVGLAVTALGWAGWRVFGLGGSWVGPVVMLWWGRGGAVGGFSWSFRLLRSIRWVLI
jgi:hypothetical protein